MGVECENDNCIGIKLAMTVALHCVPLCTGCKIGPMDFYVGQAGNSGWEHVIECKFKLHHSYFKSD